MLARVKKSLFDLLRGHVEDAVVVDLFAGTGAIGLEAISRGAARCVMVEQDRRMARVLKQNIEELGVGERAEVVVGDALGPAVFVRAPARVHLVFMDPPFELVGSASGWESVRSQASRLLPRLDETGYMVLRTPWPMVVWEPVAGGAGAGASPEMARRKRREPRGAWKRDLGRGRGSDLGPERGEERGGGPARGPEARGRGRAEDAEAESAAGAVDRPALVEASLAIDGAVGPETHVFGRMAFHVYMRERDVRG